jgi:hypothetical protein
MMTHVGACLYCDGDWEHWAFVTKGGAPTQTVVYHNNVLQVFSLSNNMSESPPSILQCFAGHGAGVNDLQQSWASTTPAPATTRASLTPACISNGASCEHIVSIRGRWNPFAETNSYTYFSTASTYQAVVYSFAAALFAIEHCFFVALGNGTGVNFHGGTLFGGYAPLAFTYDKGIVSGVQVQPEYYGMLLVSMMGPGSVVNTSTYGNMGEPPNMHQQPPHLSSHSHMG